MKMSEGVEWAVHCLSVLAVVPPGRTLPARVLADFHGVPAAYLSKHMQRLAKADIVESVSGPRGGFRLKASASEVSLLDVVEAVDGSEPAFRCTEIRQRGPSALDPRCYKKPCGIARAFAKADAAWREALRSVTLDRLVEDLGANVHPDQIARGAQWLEDQLS